MYVPNHNNHNYANALSDDETMTIDTQSHNSAPLHSNDPLPLAMTAQVEPLDVVSLFNLLKDDTDCSRLMFNSLMDNGRNAAAAAAAAEEGKEYGVDDVKSSHDIDDNDPFELVAKQIEESSRSMPYPAVEPVASASFVDMPASSVSSSLPPPRQIVSFAQSEVRQNAFFFIVSRGGMVLEQPGNRRLRRIVSMYAQQYVQTRRIDRGALKHQVFNLCRSQFEFVIQKQVFMRYYEKDVLEKSGRRQLSPGRIRSILDTNGGLGPIEACEDTDFVRVGEDCAIDVVGHLLRDAANEFRRAQQGNAKK